VEYLFMTCPAFETDLANTKIVAVFDIRRTRYGESDISAAATAPRNRRRNQHDNTER